MYQQTLGRFLSRDPLSENGIDVLTDAGFYGDRLAVMRSNPWYYGGNGENLYAYVNNRTTALFLYSYFCLFTIASIQIGANGLVHPGEQG